MGCAGSKYQTLSTDGAAKKEETPAVGAASPSEGAAPVAAAPSTAEPTTPSSDLASGNSSPSKPAVSPPAAEASPDAVVLGGAAVPELDPVPLAENNGDDDVLEMEMASENLEEKFPPWKSTDRIRPANSWLSAEAAPASPGAEMEPSTPPALEPLTQPDNTVIIFDWDDTLLCSTALHCCLPNQFEELEATVEAMLLMAMSLGRTIIVTNAMESWIQETARRFMPRLIPILDRLPIVYARNNWERIWPGDTFAWKRECFREILSDQLGSNMNLLVLGDSLSEIRAAEALASFLGTQALVKTVKFKALPSPSDLLGELRTLGPELAKLVGERHSASKEFWQDLPPGGMFSQGVFQASPTWQLLDSVPSEMFTPPPGVFAHQHLWTIMPTAPATQITI